MGYEHDDSITDQAHLLNLKDGFGPPKGTKVSPDLPAHKVVLKFSDDEREIISNLLRDYMSRKWQKPRQSAVAAMAKVHLTEVNRFLSPNLFKKRAVSVPSIIKIINAFEMAVPNRPDLSYPLLYGGKKTARESPTRSETQTKGRFSRNRFSDDDRRLISNRLVKHLHSVFGFTPTSLAKKADIDIAHIDWLTTENARDKNRPICPDQDIVKIVNIAKLKIHGRDDLSYPLSEVDQKSTELPEKVKEMVKKPEIKPEIIPVPGYGATKPVDSKSAKLEKPEEKKVIPVPATPSEIVEPDIPDKRPDLPIRVQQIIDSLEEELFTTDEEMIAAACNFAETPTDNHRHEYFLKKEIARRTKQQIILLNKVLE